MNAHTTTLTSVNVTIFIVVVRLTYFPMTGRVQALITKRSTCTGEVVSRRIVQRTPDLAAIFGAASEIANGATLRYA